jgi:hypothetical protein
MPHKHLMVQSAAEKMLCGAASTAASLAIGCAGTGAFGFDAGEGGMSQLSGEAS